MSVRPFRIDVPEAVLEDLHRRLDATIWPQTLDDAGWDYGTDIAELRALVDYWRHASTGARVEAELNRFPQFIVEIDGVDVHCIHARARAGRSRETPFVLTHGWPSTFYELHRPRRAADRGAHGASTSSCPRCRATDSRARRRAGASAPDRSPISGSS